VRSIRYQMATAKFPLAKDLAGFDFKSSPVNEQLVEFPQFSGQPA
jgi:hypothetical protein